MAQCPGKPILPLTLQIGSGSLLVAALLATSNCVELAGTDDENAIQFGALLPFTGDRAASGFNAERALLMAAEDINKANGVAGRKISVISRDAPDLQRGLASVQELLGEPGLVGVFGPQLPELFPDVDARITASDLYGMLPSEMALSPSNTPDGVRWFHLAPRIESVACAMAQTIYNDMHMQLLIVASDDEYNQTFAQALLDAYTGLSYMGSRPKATLRTFSADTWANNVNILRTLSVDDEIIALVTYPKTGALVIQDWASLGRSDTWYFGPALRTNVFVDNTPSGVIEGMKGFSAYIPEDQTRQFSKRFADRWGGDVPETDAFYHFDALALSALAIETAARGQATFPSNQSVRDSILTISRGAGTSVRWDDLAEALDLVRAGQAVHYIGASGHVDLTNLGYLESAIETISVWKIQDGQVKPSVMTTCLPQ